MNLIPNSNNRPATSQVHRKADRNNAVINARRLARVPRRMYSTAGSVNGSIIAVVISVQDNMVDITQSVSRNDATVALQSASGRRLEACQWEAANASQAARLAPAASCHSRSRSRCSFMADVSRSERLPNQAHAIDIDLLAGGQRIVWSQRDLDLVASQFLPILEVVHHVGDIQ